MYLLTLTLIATLTIAFSFVLCYSRFFFISALLIVSDTYDVRLINEYLRHTLVSGGYRYLTATGVLQSSRVQTT